MGWIAFWIALVAVNTASVVNHINNSTDPWFSLLALVFSGINLGYWFARWAHEG